MADSREAFVAFDEGSEFSGDSLTVSTIHPLPQGPLVVVKCENTSMEDIDLDGKDGKEIILEPLIETPLPIVKCESSSFEDRLVQSRDAKLPSLKHVVGNYTLTNLQETNDLVTKENIILQQTSTSPVLEITVTHTSNEHVQKSGDPMVAVYKSQKEHIILNDREITPKAGGKSDSVILINDGENVIHLSRSVIEEYRRKANYFGPLKAALERVKVIKDGEEKEVLRTKLMQVKFVMKDGAGQELTGAELVKAMSKIPGLIPPCEPHDLNASGFSEKEDGGQDSVTISFGLNDQMDIPKKVIEQYRSLSKVTDPLAAKRERSFKEENGRKIPITVVSLYPDRDTIPLSPFEVDLVQQVNNTPERPKTGRTAGGGRKFLKGRRRYQPLPVGVTQIQETKIEPHGSHNDTSSNSEAEDYGLSSLGYESGIVVIQSPSRHIDMGDETIISSGDDKEHLLPILQSAPEDMDAVLSSNQAWKYLTEYASEDDTVQGLVTQFNNESWLEVKRMSDFFHCDGEVMTDISFKAVYRKDHTPIRYYLRGFSRLIRSGELKSASTINHLFRCLSPDRKLCLGINPSLYQTELENNDQLRQYFKQEGCLVSTPIESLFSKSCKGIVVVHSNPASTSFTRDSKTIVGVQIICRECIALGKQMNLILQDPSKGSPISKNDLLGDKTTQEKYNSQLLKQPIRSRGPALSSKEIRRIFSQNVSEILASRVSPIMNDDHDDAELHKEGSVRNRRKAVSRKVGDSEGDEEHMRPSIGVSEEEFMTMIDLCPPKPGVLARSLVKKCNVCQFRAPTMLALFIHMQGHMGALKEKCGECSVQLSSKEAMDTHKKQMHTQRSPVCSICQLDFTTKDQLFDHMNKHRDHHPFECPFCEHKLTNMDAYKKHVRLTHKVKSVRDLNFACKTCNIHFYTRDHLLLHRVNQNHEDVDPFACKACSFTSVTANEFRSHIWEHSEEERERSNIAICPHCYKVFFSAFKLTFHLETKHLPEEKGTETLSKVEQDMSEQPPRKKKNKGPYLRYLRANEKYECCKCRRRFKTRETLENHEKFSHGEKKVTKSECHCSLCGRKFNALRRLANHMKIHSGSRPVFQCEECGQIYGKKTQVLEHIRTDHAEQVQRHQQQQELLQNSHQEQAFVEITTQPQHATIEGGTSSTWSPIKSPFKVPTVEQTQEAVYSLLQLTDF